MGNNNEDLWWMGRDREGLLHWKKYVGEEKFVDWGMVKLCGD